MSPSDADQPQRALVWLKVGDHVGQGLCGGHVELAVLNCVGGSLCVGTGKLHFYRRALVLKGEG